MIASSRSRHFYSALFASIFAAVIAITLGGGCADENALVGGYCAAGYTECKLRCVNLRTDPQNCGQCETVCAPGIGCGGGVCGGSEDGSVGDGFGGDGGDGGDAGPCDSPFVTAEHCGDCFTSCGGATPDCLVTVNGLTCSVCTPPLVACSNTCVDLTTHPYHCGSCNFACASEICVNSRCTGDTSGHIVVIGHDYRVVSGNSSKSRVLTNSVFISSPGTVQLLVYERYADPIPMARVEAVLAGDPRPKNLRHTSNDNEIPGILSRQRFDVLLVYDQATAPPGALAALGASWAATLTTFTKAGGVVIVLDGADGANPSMPAFMTAAGLLNVTAHTNIGIDTPVTNVAPGDVVGSNVPSPYRAGDRSVRFTTEAPGPNLVHVILDTAGNEPVVIHKTVPP